MRGPGVQWIKRRFHMRAVTLLALLIASPLFAKSLAPPLVVHEWGTFTSLQDESGRAIGGINSSDENLPAFVPRFDRQFIVNDLPPNPWIKQGARPHPDVTMRMETPVIHF